MKNSKKFRELSDEDEKEILEIPEGLHEHRTTIRLLINHLLNTDMKALFLLERKGRAWIYTNELPEDAMIRFISDAFVDDPHLMNMVMKEYNDEMGIEEPKKREEIEEEPELIEQIEPEQNPDPDPKPDDYLTPKDIEKTYQLATKTLANWRSQGRGPEFFKLGNKVRYLRKNVDKWVEQSRRKIYQSK
ncbi:helix-turn-helix domain-containing protein [Candidatus Woesearchaeota archaeon]|nr:helix-turn-helix domain-containing protein [Candidatus Woesearchaeota archaeon]